MSEEAPHETRDAETDRPTRSVPPPAAAGAPPVADSDVSIAPGSSVVPSVLHPRGLITPPLPLGAPRLRRAWRSVYRLVQGLYFHDAFQAAPAMAFHFFLSLLPLFVFLGYVVGSIAQKSGVQVLWPILDYFPEAAAGVFKKELERMADASTLGPIAAIGFLWLASGGTHGLMDALETAVGAPRRPWWKKRLLAAGWVIGSLLALTIGSLGVVQWETLIHPPEAPPVASASVDAAEAPPSSATSARAEVDPPASISERATSRAVAARRRVKLLRDGGERVLAVVVTMVFSVLALAGFYWFSVSHPSRVRRVVLPGATLAVALAMLVSWGFGLYVRTLTNYAVFYGSLAAVAVLLVWLWLASLAILVGAEWNAQLEGLRD